jgi:magnesium transporter
MITVWELNSQKKEVVTVSLEKYQIGKTLSWVDCYKPSQKEFEAISHKTGLPIEVLRDSIDPNTRPHVVSYDKFSLIISRAPYRDEHGEVHPVPVSLVLFKKDIFTLHEKPIAALEEFRSLPRGQLLMIFRKGAPYFVYRFLDAAIGEFFDVMERVDLNIDAIEDKAVSNANENVTKEIFHQKRDLIHIHKALIANRDVISAIEKRYLEEFKDEDLLSFRDLYHDTAQLIDLVSTSRDVLTSILDMYLSSVSNNMNKVVKTLTALSAFVLIPTLIASIYGMNFHGGDGAHPWNMPELYWQHGYLFALGLIALSFIGTFIYFKKKDWL